MTKPEPEQGDNRRGAIAGLVIAIVLLSVGIWLAHDLFNGFSYSCLFFFPGYELLYCV